ncbi:MAG: response regulator transcription factor [Aquincola sp.]|nr:response regulator transcription factor [Aquincola sp.]MDH4289346.1 response regulator transcription factor [Aquincola sp.]MDH5330379.1 response regulator transcription factor [Aquincola sp.]
MRLLLIEDDPTLGEGLRDYLRADGHRVDWCRRLADADALHAEPYDAWLVDWQLPDGSGVEWLHARRMRGGTTPALVLTARDRLGDRVAGLDAGADDYLVKPFAPEELAARLRAVSRRTGAGAAHSRATFGKVVVDLAARSAFVGGVRVELTAREWTVLEALVLRAGRIVPKADLEKLVHGFDSEIASNALEVHVSALRRKLGRELIDTVRGLGYRIELPAPV